MYRFGRHQNDLFYNKAHNMYRIQLSQKDAILNWITKSLLEAYLERIMDITFVRARLEFQIDSVVLYCVQRHSLQQPVHANLIQMRIIRS